MFFSSSFIMRYPNCVSQFLSIQHDRYTKNNLEMILIKKNMESNGVSSLN